jgi:DNA-binding GntR family transcriptional regulator
VRTFEPASIISEAGAQLVAKHAATDCQCGDGRSVSDEPVPRRWRKLTQEAGRDFPPTRAREDRAVTFWLANRCMYTVVSVQQNKGRSDSPLPRTAGVPPRESRRKPVTRTPRRPSATQVKAKETLADEVHRQLRDLIVALKLSPGTSLSESELTMRLGVSRTPIREALQRLHQEGFAVVHHVGAISRMVVAPMTVEDMRELHAILSALEGLAARAAAQLPDAARQALAGRMANINTDLRAAWKAGPQRVRSAQDLHVQFHRTCAEAAAGPRLLAELNAIQPQVERYERVYTAALAPEFSESLLEHEQIVAAIAAGDADEAERAVIKNWRRGTERYAQIVHHLGERGSW